MAENSHFMPVHDPKIWERVPKRNPDFTGREDLLAALRKSIGTVTAVVAQPLALQGFGGVGKTQLAVEYAWQYRAHYDLVWWVSADQPLLVPSSLAAMAPVLGLPPSASTGVEQATQAVLRALESGSPYRSWLVIFDNAEEPEEIKEYIPRGPGHVVITSRNTRWSDHEATIEVDVFKRDESVAFLRKRLGRSISDVNADRLAEKLGDLPLALVQAAALLARTLMPLDEYIALLDEQTGRLLNLEKAPSYPLSMTAAWRLSVARLEDQVPEAVELLRCCAFFGPEPIPRDVFRRGSQAVVSRLAPILADPILLSTALSTLERLALVKIDQATRTLQVHRLNQALLRDELSEEGRREMRHEVHLLLADNAPVDPDDTSKWAYFDELAAHLERSGVIECEDPVVREFAHNIVRYLYVRGSYRQAQSLVGQCIDEWSRTNGERHIDVLVARGHLGNIYRALALYPRAYELESVTLEMMRESLGPEHAQTLWAINGYAATLRGRGDFLRARELDEQAHEAQERLYGTDDMTTLRVSNNLAVDHMLTSNYQHAQSMLKEIFLKLSQAREGIGKRLLLQSWSNLGRTVRLGGQFNEAADVGEEAYAYGVKELGPDHPDTLRAAKDYAISLRRGGRLEEALELMKDTHARLYRLYGDKHADTLAAAMGLSNTLRAGGNLDEARLMAERSLRDYPEVFGEDHPFTHACTTNLALLTRLMGDPAKARHDNEKALARLTTRVSREHDYSVTCAINLQNDLAALGEHDRARELGEENYRRIQTYFSPEHYLSLVCATNLALDLQATGAEEGAKRLQSESMRHFDLIMGREHPETLAAMAGERLNCDFDPPPV
ncbi:FxSxx-COOH system tetratricopeptide repeat protein [Nonomuraea sp. NPDC005650]|uniref:FxSxx-COOH system tetratricopeptide repeat protein n=1 Tax=Nonomuraea sp. NPDC005650 TaxID=3157045 RepID=UPI0033A59E90